MNNNKIFHPELKASYVSCIMAFILNILLAYVFYFLCRVIFVLVNYDAFREGWSALSKQSVLTGGLLFDTSAILYTNAPYALLMLIPIMMKERRIWQSIARVVYIFINSIAIILNLSDVAYFAYTGRRTTMSVFSEFSHETNIWEILLKETLGHWYLLVIGVIMIFVLCRLAVSVEELRIYSHGKTRRTPYYVTQVIALLLYVPLCVAGMRGGFTTAVRPITISNANQYVNRPAEAAIVLNTPFSMIRTIGKVTFKDPKYMSDSVMVKLYNPVFNTQNDSTIAATVSKKKNVVILIVESFGREYIGGYNDGKLDNGKYKGYTPFVDELIKESLTFDYTFANGRKSIDGMPSILSSIPQFVEPFFLTPASLNDVGGIARELGFCGYESAFFHGAENGSMGFQAFAKTTGYKNYYGRSEYNQDNRFGGDEDYDGTWAIWDEPFMQFYALKMTEMKEPFITSLFTASSHSPFNIPEKYAKMFPEEGNNPIHKCIRYTDMALRKFFETAKKQPWYKNTIFVLTSDHTNISDHKEYQTDLGVFGAPILFFDPSGEMPRGRFHSVAQQIDIMPTLLQYLGYSRPYVAFGCDLLNTPSEKTWAVNYINGIYQFVKGNVCIQFDGHDVKAAYNYREDWMMRHNIKDNASYNKTIEQMKNELKAIIQNYMQRMEHNRLVIGGK